MTEQKIPIERALVAQPTVSIEELHFSDGTRLTLGSTDIVVLVGPNNAGKSAALREIEEIVRTDQGGKVVFAANIRKEGSKEDLASFITQQAVQDDQSRRNQQYNLCGISIHESHISQWWTTGRGIQDLTRVFCLRLDTEKRLTDSNAAQAYRVFQEPAVHPIQMLYADDALEEQVSRYFAKAFGEELVVHRLGGSQIPLLTGKREEPRPGEDRITKEYCQRLWEAGTELSNQGDGMRSFATVLLHIIAPSTPSMIMLDEPEAFLHPPQAYLLGQVLATERTERTQLFVATHSVDVIRGLLQGSSEGLHLLRIERVGNTNLVTELDKQRTAAINSDPLLHYSNVLSGIFHKRVVVCESDSDCMFYHSLLDSLRGSLGVHPDVLFIHANGKQRLAILAESMKVLNVPVDIIADIDILRNADDLQRCLTALGGQFESIESEVVMVQGAVQDLTKQSTKEDLRVLQDVCKYAKERAYWSSENEKRLQNILKRESSWQQVKRGGGASLPRGQASAAFKAICEECERHGLWIVPVGEVEGFCKTVGGKGPKWVQEVIEEELLGSDELDGARKFIQRIWNYDTRQDTPKGLGTVEE